MFKYILSLSINVLSVQSSTLYDTTILYVENESEPTKLTTAYKSATVSLNTITIS